MEQHIKDQNYEGENLIFLISQPRSGSTMLQLILSGHPDVTTCSEPWVALHPLYALRENGIQADYDAQLARKAVIEFFRQSEISIDYYRKQIATFLGSFYTQAIQHQSKRYFLDKTPRYYHIASELMEVFPKAKFIILIRNPIAVLNSILKSWLKGDVTRLIEFKEDLITCPRQLVDCMRNNPGRFIRVNYEELLTDPAKYLKSICKYLGISFSVEMLNYRGRLNPEWKYGDNVGIYKADIPSCESIDKWKHGFTSAQDRHFAISYLHSLGPELIETLGYSYTEIESTIPPLKESNKINLISWSTVMSTPLELLKKQKEDILNSRSWKITAPLRYLVSLFKKNDGYNY